MFARLVRDSTCVHPTIKPLMEAIRRDVAMPHGLFVGAVCESVVGQKSKWSGIIIGSSDPTAGVPHRPLVDVVYDPRTICLLLYDEKSPREPGEKWHLRLQEDSRGCAVFLTPWVQDLASLLALEEGGQKAATYLSEGKFYGAITDQHVEKLVCLTPQAWWANLYDSSKAQGLTPTGSPDDFLGVVLTAPKELFRATFFFRGSEQERTLLGAIRRAFDAELVEAAQVRANREEVNLPGPPPVPTAMPMSARRPRETIMLHREAGATDAEVSFDIRVDVAASSTLGAYLVRLARSAQSRPLTQAEEGRLQDLLSRRLAVASGLPLPGGPAWGHMGPQSSPAKPDHQAASITAATLSRFTGGAKRYTLDLGVVLSEDDPHLLLTMVGRPFVETTHDKADRLTGSLGAHVDLASWRREASPEMMEVAQRSWGVINALSCSDADLAHLASGDIDIFFYLKELAERSTEGDFDLAGLPRQTVRPVEPKGPLMRLR